MARIETVTVLVCDDDANRGEQVVTTLVDSGVVNRDDVTPKFGAHLTNELVELTRHVRKVLDHHDIERSQLEFDRHDIAIIDDNLTRLDTIGARLTAEAVGGSVRAFTRVPYIISLNKNTLVDFDLKHLVGDVETYADIALNTDHLENRALWTGRRSDVPSETKFFPWYWPVLQREPRRRERQISFVRDRLEHPVLQSLGLPVENPDAMGFLSLHAKSALSSIVTLEPDPREPQGVLLEKLTFLEVFRGRGRSLPTLDDRTRLAALAGRNDRTGEYARDCIARVVAADIDLWFRRDVIGPQALLVDIPHLLVRMPFLLGARAGEFEAWNQAVDAEQPPFGLDAGLYETYLEPARYRSDMWVTRPVFFWPKLKDDDELGDQFFKADQASWADVVFAEDQSAFVLRNPTDSPPPAEVSTRLEGAWARRYVAKIARIKYAPLTAFDAG
jgi:hypothetical protein